MLMLENAVYSVCSPEACASILFRDPAQRAVAAKYLRLTAEDLYRLGVADEIVREPEGGAHFDPEGMMEILKERITHHLGELLKLDRDELPHRRMEKYAAIGEVIED